jgi:membrane protease YdiL (CAAX protease family)
LRIPGTASLVFLALILVYVPWAAFRSSRQVHAMRAGAGTGGGVGLDREAVWLSSLFSLGVLLAAAWLTARTFGYAPFARPVLRARDGWWAAAALAAAFGSRSVVRATRSDEERRTLMVLRLVPRSGREVAIWVSMVVVASVSEEVVYRGVTMSILWYATGSFWLSAMVCSLAFAAAHRMQGAKSGAAIFAIAMLMHGLVALTRTLYLAMCVHAVYDFVAGALIRRDARAPGGPDPATR